MLSLFSVVGNRRFRFEVTRSLFVLTLATGMLSWGASGRVWAAVFASGDVTPQQTFTDVNIGGQLVDLAVPNIPSGGGVVTDDGTPGGTPADLIVGGTGVFSGTTLPGFPPIGTTVGDISINNPTGTLPLIADHIFIGKEANGIGRISMNDFGTTLIANDDATVGLTIGDMGQGELQLANGARIHVGMFNADPTILRYENGETIIGSQADLLGTNQFISNGIVGLDGFGTLMETDTLTVADEGNGTIELSGKANLVTLDSTLGETAGSLGRVSLTGLGTRWNNVEFAGGAGAGKITIGMAGSGIVDINNQAVVAADNVEVNTTSFVNLSGGTIQTTSTSATAIDNNGVIRGSGRIESALTIKGTGELRNKADVNNIRETLLVTGPVVNMGTIESIGGEMEFEDLVTNDLEIIARDAIMRFSAGLTNTATLVVGGDSTIHGTITQTGGELTVLSDSSLLVIGDLTFTSGILSLALGPASGTLDVTGMAELGGALFDLSYSAGIASQTGDAYQIFQAVGGIMGFTSPTPAVADGRIWDITQVGDTLVATATGALAVPVGADFNGDGIVNQLDLNVWESNFGSTGTPPIPGDADGDGDVDGTDFLIIQGDFGGAPTPAVAAAGAVPEPSTALLLVFGSLLLGTRSMGRKRRNTTKS